MILPTNEAAVGTAHSKLILVGEHSVVYGQPAIALPFQLLQVTSTVEEGDDGITLSSPFYHGSIDNIPEKLQGLAACIRESLLILQRQHASLRITIHSMIPIGRGLGSSAAIAVAIVRGIFTYFDEKLSQKKLMSLVHLAETYAHGNPSGIDMACVVHDDPIWFEKGQAVQAIQVQMPLYMIVADSGRVGDTYGAVSSVREKYKKNQPLAMEYIEYLGQMAKHARAALQQGDRQALGQILNNTHDALIRLGVSDHGLDYLVKAARKAGAIGAKLTGGGRGGCILALSEDQSHAEKISDALKRAGASETWLFTLG